MTTDEAQPAAPVQRLVGRVLTWRQPPPCFPSSRGMVLDENEVNLIRQWFDSLRDVNAAYLEKQDYAIGEKIYGFLGYKYVNLNPLNPTDHQAPASGALVHPVVGPCSCGFCQQCTGDYQ